MPSYAYDDYIDYIYDSRSSSLQSYLHHKGCDPQEHWEPGSRQPLRLKVSTTGKAQKDKRLWPGGSERGQKRLPKAAQLDERR